MQVISSDERYQKTYPVSWDQLHRDSKALAWRLLEFGPFNGIIAIARGGLVPAAIVARELNVRRLETICVISYEERTPGEGYVSKGLDAEGMESGAGWLIIDDLVDTGRTAQIVRAMLPKARFAAVYAKPEGRPLVDTYITEVSQDTWILFPWDSEVQYVRPLISL